MQPFELVAYEVTYGVVTVAGRAAGAVVGENAHGLWVSEIRTRSTGLVTDEPAAVAWLLARRSSCPMTKAQPSRVLEDVVLGDPLVVEQTLGDPRPQRGVVERITDHFAYVRIGGAKDMVRVSKVSGKGTLHQVQYVAKRVDPAVLQHIDRTKAADSLRTAIFLANQACTGKSPGSIFDGDADELAELERRLREVVRLPPSGA